ncbi:hypothetical protein O0L34_g4086 [Tuta absoluta]|nr:hypothetical protein O0L34_g13089 [Tuta absoluta]KAJ2944727.1 hypothetical protein O0L34_g4086 [Tuta absoluta]
MIQGLSLGGGRRSHRSGRTARLAAAACAACAGAASGKRAKVAQSICHGYRPGADLGLQKPKLQAIYDLDFDLDVNHMHSQSNPHPLIARYLLTFPHDPLPGSAIEIFKTSRTILILSTKAKASFYL